EKVRVSKDETSWVLPPLRTVRRNHGVGGGSVAITRSSASRGDLGGRGAIVRFASRAHFSHRAKRTRECAEGRSCERSSLADPRLSTAQRRPLRGESTQTCEATARNASHAPARRR